MQGFSASNSPMAAKLESLTHYSLGGAVVDFWRVPYSPGGAAVDYELEAGV